MPIYYYEINPFTRLCGAYTVDWDIFAGKILFHL